MNHLITAIYEKGVLHPLIPLALPDYTRVRVSVQPMCKEAADPRNRVREVLFSAGLTSPPESDSPFFSRELTSEQREYLARLFGEKGPLSEMIMTEREGR